MRNCFEQLKKELPKGQEEKKTSNLSILSSALNFITVSGEGRGGWGSEHVVNELRNLLFSASSLPSETNIHADAEADGQGAGT